MKKVIQSSLHGWSAKTIHGWAVRVGAFVLGATLFLVALGPITASAQSGTVSQLQYLQWMVQLTGDSAQFSAASTEADYQQWARSKNMDPTGGWMARKALTRDDLAQTLVQLYGLTPKKSNSGTDWARILEREGIDLPSGNLVTRSALVGLVDEFGFQSRTALIAKKKHSKNKKDTKKDTKTTKKSSTTTKPKPPKPHTHKKTTKRK
jgi:hypothetical protein